MRRYAFHVKSKTRRRLGASSLVASFAVAGALGLLTTSESPPALSTSALLVVISGVLQLGSYLAFSGVGKVDPTVARSAVRRLAGLASVAHQARVEAEALEGVVNRSRLDRALGKISVSLSILEDQLYAAIQEWKDTHGEALKDLPSGEADSND
jgi:hypothetical protein